MLTTDDLTTLRKVFPANAHEFLRGFAYITEGAITTRMEDVDPAWSFEILAMSTRDNQVIVTARLTIKDVSRDGVGMAAVLDKGAGEPEKSAATDALKRCARLFGIGRYLLDLPENVKDAAGLTRWLNGSTPANVTQVDKAALNPQPEPRRVMKDPTLPPVKVDVDENGEPIIVDATPKPQTASILKVTVKKRTNGNANMLTLTMDNNLPFINVFSRQPFIEAGWITETMWKSEGEISLGIPIPVTLKRDKTGRYWELDSVTPPVNPFLQNLELPDAKAS